MSQNPPSPPQLHAALYAHGEAIAFRLLGDPVSASTVAAAVADRIAEGGAESAAYPFAFLAAGVVERCLVIGESAPTPDTTFDPHLEQRRWLRQQLSQADVATRTVVALGLLCGYDPDTTATMTRRSAAEVEALLAPFAVGLDIRGMGDRSLSRPGDAGTPDAAAMPRITPAPPARPPAEPAAHTDPGTEPAPPLSYPSPEPADRTPRRRRRVRGSTILAVTLVAAAVWVVTYDGGQRPSLADPAVGAGGGTSPCAVNPGLPLGDATTESVAVGSVTRQFTVRLPARLDPSSRLPLLLVMADGGTRAGEWLEASGLSDLADRATMAVALLQAEGAAARWNVTRDPAAADDVEFARTVLGQLAGRFCIDTSRVALVGFGTGAQMAGTAVCALADAVTHVVMMAGAHRPTECPAARGVSVLTISFDEDDVFPPGGGVGPGLARLPADSAVGTGALTDPAATEAVVTAWVAVQSCAQPPGAVPALPGGRGLGYQGCRDGTVVHDVRGPGGHAWSVTGADLAVQFVSAYPRV